MTFDANSTTIRLVDDNGGTSAWAYDLQDHQTTMTFHDGATTMDSMDRLIQYQRGTLDSGGASITTPIGLPNTDAQRAYALDGLGNWKNTAFTPEGGASETELRTHNKLNQIVAFGVPTASTPITYDQGNNVSTANPTRGNGNIANDGTLTYMYDALNRLITVTRISDSAVLGTYAYDALGRRIYAGTGPYLYDGQQIVEELVGGTTSLQYVWGQYIDEPVQLNAVQPQGPQSVTGVNYLLSDLLYRSAALTAGDRSIVEAYDTDAYGNTLLFSGPGADSTWFTNDDTQATYSACRYVFTGREYDAESELYYFRARSYLPAFGRFTQRDSFLVNVYVNLQEYARGAPENVLDPTGQLYIPPPVVAPGSSTVIEGILSAAGEVAFAPLLAATWFLTGGATTMGNGEDLSTQTPPPLPQPDPKDDPQKKRDDTCPPEPRKDCTTPPYNLYKDCEILEWNYQYTYTDPDSARKSCGSDAIWKPGQGPAAATGGPCAGTGRDGSYHRTMVWKGRRSGYPGSVVGCKCCDMPHGTAGPTLE